MDTTLIVILVVAVAAVAAVAAVMYAASRKHKVMQDRYGPEYRRAVEEAGSRRKADKALAEREERVKRLDIRPLAAGEQRSFIESWRSVQAEFVDNPHGAIIRADRLLGDVMAVRGYPVADFEQRAADLSVEHPELVHNYRVAHAVASRGDDSSTEDLRQAMIHYRALFGELVDPTEADAAPRARRRTADDHDGAAPLH